MTMSCSLWVSFAAFLGAALGAAAFAADFGADFGVDFTSAGFADFAAGFFGLVAMIILLKKRNAGCVSAGPRLFTLVCLKCHQ